LIECPSFSTAIVVVPPQHLHNEINFLRSVYDKSHPRWSPHITLSIPFVSASDLPRATRLIHDVFSETTLLNPWQITFSKTDFFMHKDSATVYLKPDEDSERRLRLMREKLETVFFLGKNDDGIFRPHLTIGQTSLDDSVQLLREKAEMLLPISWTFEGLLIINKNELDGGRMEVFATIPENHTTLVPSASSQSIPPSCYSYSESEKRYEVYQSTSLFDIITPPSPLTISSYNILHSPLQPQTPGSPRLALLLEIILNQHSTVLVLQEVTDTAWQYFLSSPSLRTKFPYISSPSHLPLPNHRNIVILATVPFKAYYLPLVSAHKPALIADFTTFLLAGIHLTSGLHEEKLSLKHKELSKLTSHLQSTPNRPVILAGDFNIPKQSREYTAALPKVLQVLERYEDTWLDGEDTFVPEVNRFALEGTKSLLPQRYDRILCTEGWAKVVERRVFGRPVRDQDLASDHWGVSVTLDITPDIHVFKRDDNAVGGNFEMWKISDIPKTSWTDPEITTLLHTANILPSPTHDTALSNSISLLQSILSPLDSQIPFLLQPLGSFTLGAHTRSSDLDILAVSTISPKTFWTLFLQHLYRFKLTTEGGRVKLLRVIREAKAPMVDLLVDGFSFEVLYCAAGRLLPMYSSLMSPLLYLFPLLMCCSSDIEYCYCSYWLGYH
jgi:2'-5' RNA ligase